MIEDRIFSVYIHKFPNGKQYVGITSVKPETRWKNGNGYKHNKILHEDIKKYGWDNIEHILFNEEDILYDEEEACYIEKCLIDSWDLTNPEIGYNLCSGGTSSYTLHKNTRKKLSESRKQSKKVKASFIKKFKPIIQYSLEGKKIAEFSSIVEVANNFEIDASSISKCCRGKLISTGNFMWRYKSNNLNSIKPKIEYKRPTNCKAVLQYTINNIFLNEFSSIKEASQITKANKSHICNCCSGKRKTAGGYIWKYKE